jgi:hypothetical protein
MKASFFIPDFSEPDDLVNDGYEGGGQVREIFYQDGLPMHCIVLMNMRMNY